MSRAYKRRKKNREIGDMTYPEGGGRVSCNAYLSMHRKMSKRLRMDGQKSFKPEYGKFIEIGNQISRSEQTRGL